MTRTFPGIWADKHNAHAWLLPFEHKVHNPWEILIDLRDYFSGLYKFAATWTWSEIDRSHVGNQRNTQDKYAAFCGGYRIQESDRANKYVNPTYYHDYPGEPVLGKEHIALSADTGMVDIETVADAVNRTPEHVKEWCKEHGDPWGQRRERGKERVANAIHVAEAWTEMDIYDFANALNCGTDALWEFYHDHRTLEGPVEMPNTKSFSNKPMSQ